MGSKNSAPPPPDYSPLINAQTAVSQQDLALQQQQFDWAKQQAAAEQPITDAAQTAATKAMNEESDIAEQDQARYENTFVPLQDQFIQTAKNYDTPQQEALNAGQAAETVNNQVDAQRLQAQNQLEGYGIDPSSTRFQALDRGMGVSGAAASAGAANQAIQTTKNTGLNLMSQAINMGSGLPGQVTSAYGSSVGAGSTAVGEGNSTNSTNGSLEGTATQYGSLGSGAINSAGSLMNNSYNNQMAQFNANQNSSSGWGTVLGMGAKMLFAADGGAIPTGASPQPVLDPTGATVPQQASPSAGAITDDVPARLSPGEFVMPKDVVSWYGEKAMHDMIIKATKDKQKMVQQSGAIPTLGPANGPGANNDAPPAQATAQRAMQVGAI